MKIAVAEARRIEKTAPSIASEKMVGEDNKGRSSIVCFVENAFVSLVTGDDEGEVEVVADNEDDVGFDGIIPVGVWRETDTDDEVDSLLLLWWSSSRGSLSEVFRRHWTSMTSSTRGRRRLREVREVEGRRLSPPVAVGVLLT